MNDFKTYREKELKYFALINIIIIYFASQNKQLYLSQENITFIILKYIFEQGLFASMIYLFTLVIDLIYPPYLKSCLLLYFRKSKCTFFRMPGEKIFSNISKYNDVRINKRQIQEHYKNILEKIPENKLDAYAYQNYEFYKLYQKNINDKIMASFKEYILCRDMTSQLFAFFLLTLILSIVKNITINKYIYLYYLIMYIILVFSSRYRANKYVLNVIIEDFYKNDDKN